MFLSKYIISFTKIRRKITLFVVFGSYNKSKLPMVIPSHFELEYIIRENTVLF